MKTGLVLEGGALRTIYSSGVCDGLLAGGVMADYVVGVSAGIAYGVSYISGQSGRNLEIVTRFARDRRYMGLGNLLDPKNRSYFGLDFTYRQIPETLIPFDYEAFAAFPGQVEAVVTELETGKARYCTVPRDKEGSSLVLQATCALPLMFPSYQIEGVECVDGGVADSIPYRRAFEQGCDRVIVVLTRPWDYVKKADRSLPLVLRKYRKWPEFCKTMAARAERYNESRRQLFELERRGKVLVIAPEDTHGVSRTERNVEKLRLLWADGYRQAADRMDEIRTFVSGN
ncbi:MAG: patatin family protein [Oscillospiraceae bacterium]|nr:patatin family protein [Oscillospiraceae bacterium]